MAEDSTRLTNEFDAIKKITLLQATFRGHFARTKIKKAQELYQDIFKSIEGSAVVEDLQWVYVHGRLPLPVYKHKEPELAVFMRRLTVRDIPDKARIGTDPTCTSNSDSDTGTYTVITSEKYSSIASEESSTLSGKTTSLVAEDFPDDDNVNATGSRIPSERNQTSDVRNRGNVEDGTFSDRPEMNSEMQLEERSLNRETCNAPNNGLKVDGRNTTEDGKNETTDNLILTETGSRRSRVKRNVQHLEMEIQTNDDDDTLLGEDGERIAPLKERDSDFNLLEISELRKDKQVRTDSDTMMSGMELPGENVDERFDKSKEDETVSERLQEGMLTDDEDDLEKDNEKQEASENSHGRENTVGTTPDVDDGSKQSEESIDTKRRQFDKRILVSSEGDEGGINNRESFKESDEKSAYRDNDARRGEEDGTSAELLDAGDTSQSKDKIEQKNYENEMLKRGRENNMFFITPPSPILCRPLPDKEPSVAVSSSSPISSDDTREIAVLSQTRRLKGEGNDVDGDSMAFTRVTSLGASLVSEQTSVWDSDSDEMSLVGTLSFPQRSLQDLTQLQALRKDVAMELLWVQQAIESRTAYLRLKANLEEKDKGQKIQTGV